MLPNHDVPLVVAEQFGTLASLYPGRIDLGVGRGAPDPLTAQVLARSLANYGGDYFAESVAELSAYLTGESPDGRPHRGPYVAPRADEPPSVWVLGAAPTGRLTWRRSSVCRSLSRTTSAAPTDVEADAIAASADLMFAQFFQGGRRFAGRLPSPEEAAAHTWSADERAFAAQRHHGHSLELLAATSGSADPGEAPA